MPYPTIYKSSLGSVLPNEWNLQSIDNCRVEEIGKSRRGKTIYGLSCGKGPLRVSITAGAHADEPVGPRAATFLAESVAQGNETWAADLAELCTFRIVPHVNPDGDADNAEWQQSSDNFVTYLKHSVREKPGDDVEFNYPKHSGDKTRPENIAAAQFLAREDRPYDVHASLHSMGIAEGAWFLICREWAERAERDGMFHRLANRAGLRGLSLHDWERNGEKGFNRLAPGFCTAPRADKMKEFFEQQGDGNTAALFRPSSMEFVQSLGGDPLCIVSEVPYFEIRSARGDDSPLTDRPFHRLKDKFPSLRTAAAEGDFNLIRAVVSEFQLTPVSFETHRNLQIDFLIEAIKLAAREKGLS